MFLSEEKVDIVGQRPSISRELIESNAMVDESTGHGNDVMVVIIHIVSPEF